MPVGHEDHGGIPMTPAVLPRGQVFPGVQVAMGRPSGADVRMTVAVCAATLRIMDRAAHRRGTLRGCRGAFLSRGYF